MFSQTVDYILRVVVHLSALHPHAATTQDISTATQVPLGYLAKIMQRLVKSGLVQSQRGRKGGFVLEEKSLDLSLYDVIQKLEPISPVRICPKGANHPEGLCPLHRQLDRAIAGVEQTLRDATLRSLALLPCNTASNVPATV